MSSRRQSLRAFVAFLVIWSFLLLTVTGIVLYVVPQGRVAYWVEWTLAGLGKDDWADVHMIFGGLFIATGVIHLYYNWKPFKKYLAERAAGHLRVKRELVLSLAACIVLVAFSVLEWPPVSWVFDLNDDIKESWVIDPDYEPPFGHAEEVSLAGLALRQDIDLDAAVRALREQGLVLTGTQERIEDIARANELTPMEVYRIIKPLERPRTPPSVLSPEAVEAKYAGTGVGRKTLAQISEEVGVDPRLSRQRLAAATLPAEDGETLKDIADRGGINPIDVLKVILIEGWRPQ